MIADRIFRWALAVVIAVMIPNLSGAQADKSAVREIKAHRKEQRKEFRDPDKSPLTPEDRAQFRHLNYFEIDLTFRVNARFLKTDNSPLFAMKTTTDRLPEYRKFGEVHFQIDGQPLVLEVYQNPEIMQRPGYEDYLFIPFTDDTNGYETYEVGRYLDFRVPESDTVIVDFNKAYNPYCAYSGRYSCPIPPAVNHIGMRIEAGEKKFSEGH